MQSIMSRVLAAVFRFREKLSEEKTEANMKQLLQQRETPSAPPKLLKTRYAQYDNGGIFFANEEAASKYIIFYIHGGAYVNDFSPEHWRFMNKLIRETDAVVIAPAYRRIPYACWREAFDLIIPVYKEYAEANPKKKFIMMGDSAGGGLALALTEQIRLDGIRMPDELILLSPWIDAAMENPDVVNYQDKDPWLSVPWLKVCGRYWAGDTDPHDFHISPVNGDLSALSNVTVFSGTKEVFYPDLIRFYDMLKHDPTNELYVAKDMLHVYPLLPIPEAKSACSIIYQKIMR